MDHGGRDEVTEGLYASFQPRKVPYSDGSFPPIIMLKV